jgi:hypothetical protein
VSQQINLFNPAFRKQRVYFAAVAMLQALGLISVGMALLYAYASYQVHQLSRQSAETASRFAAERGRLERYMAEYLPQKSTQNLTEELHRLESQAAAQQSVIATLKSGAIANTAGYSEYLRAFARQAVPGLWLTGFDIEGDGAQISLSGGVLNPGLVPVYVQRLSHEKVMQGKTFAALQMQRPQAAAGRVADYTEFTLQSVEADGTGK